MNRLTRQDILRLLEDEKTFAGVRQVGVRSRADTLNDKTLAQKAKSRPSYMVFKKKGDPEVHHEYHAAKRSLGSESGHIENNWPGERDHGKILHRNDSVETVPYYRQLKEACAAYVNEELINAFDNTDETYAAYGAAIKRKGETANFFGRRTERHNTRKSPGTGTAAKRTAIKVANSSLIKEGVVASARRKGAANLRTIGEIVGQIPDPRAKLLKSGADFQAGLIDSPKNEDTMTGDIGSVEMGMGAVPLRGMGPADEEDRKRRGKKRRKMATLMGIATGSVQGVGN